MGNAWVAASTAPYVDPSGTSEEWIDVWLTDHDRDDQFGHIADAA